MTHFFRFLLLAVTFVGRAFCHVNLLISNAEMNRTLGLNAEMNYVENGVVNSYSTKFPYRVDSHIDHVTFTWQANERISYAVRADAEDMSVLPVLHIPSFGEVPRAPQEFSLEYRCAGHRAGQFVVSLHFNFTTSSGKLTSVRLRQEKICASRDGRRGLSGSYSEDVNHREAAVEDTFLLIIIAAGVFLIVIAVLLFSYFRRTKKESTNCTPQRLPTFARAPSAVPSLRQSLKNSVRTTGSSQPFLTSTPIKQPAPSTSQSILDTTIQLNSPLQDTIFHDRPNNVDIRKALVSLHADREPFHTLPFVDAEGTFGEIRFAIWRQTDDQTNGDVDDEEDAVCLDEAVMCKTLKKHATPSQLDKFLQEALSFHNVPPHKNLAQVACAASFGRFDVPSSVVDFPLICYRHQGFGNFRKFLISCRDGDKKGALRPQDMVSLCVQLSRALAHLHRYFVLHKDIATRNCIISEVGKNLVVQLCDPALSKDLFPQDYHCLGDNDNRPIKWMSPEAIAQRQMSSAGDAWSFGVLCWEIFSLGAAPFADIDAEDMQEALLRGVRLSQPFSCPDQAFNVIFCCWREKPKERPNADHICVAFEQVAGQMSQFV